MADSDMVVTIPDVSDSSMKGKRPKSFVVEIKVDWVDEVEATLPSGVNSDSRCLPEAESGTYDVEIQDKSTADASEDNTSISDPLEKHKSWSELTCRERVRTVVLGVVRPVAVLTLLYLFICSLDLLSSAFRLVGGKTAGNAFSSNVLIKNPVAGLMIGILSTVLVQSSSTSTSIVVAMVSSGILEVRPAIPIIMGANIGTSLTNTIVSLAQSSNKGQFKLAFAGATVHDMFNWLAVLVLLPIEVASGYLFHTTKFLLDRMDVQTQEGANKDILKAITKPLTNLVVQLDKNVIKKLALGHTEYQNRTLLKQWCAYEKNFVPLELENGTDLGSNSTNIDFEMINGTAYVLEKEPTESCVYLFKLIPLSDTFLGLLLMLISLTILCTCLVLIVKILNASLKGPVSKAAKKIINKDLPGKCAYFTGYLAILAGAGLTIVVQSSSVFTSTLTPLVGLNIISLERMYPLTLGSNIGTTTTGLLAAMAAPGDKLQPALQIALVHLIFNISGILLFYPVPFMRFPIPMARVMGETTFKYRWFAVLYLVGMFFLLPGGMFALSVAGTIPFAVVCSVSLAFILFLVTINVLKKKFFGRLPEGVKKCVSSMPRCFYSLKPMEEVVSRIFSKIKELCCCCCKKTEKESVASSEPMLHDSFSSNGSNTILRNTSFYDKMTEDERREYECTVRSLEEVKCMLTADTVEKSDVAETGLDSGYVTQLNTPYISKFPSREDLH